MFDQNNKLTKQFEDTIDIADILNTIWEGKFKIIFIVLASIIIGAIYNYQKPELYKVSLDIRKGKDTEFIKFLPINKFFNEYELNEIIEITDQKDPINIKNQMGQINKETIFDRFIEEFLDYEELLEVLEKDNEISKQLSDLNTAEKQTLLFKYAKRFKVEQLRIKNKANKDTIVFIWADKDQAVRILNATLDRVLDNLQNAIFMEIDEFLTIKQYVDVNKDLVRIDRLLEQSAIAKELNIAESSMDSVNLSNSNVSFNINTSGSAYYLRGFKAIDKEISLIKKRRYRELENFEKELSLIRNNKIKLIDYNIFSVETESLKTEFKTIWLMATFVGLVIGVFFTIILKSFQRYNAAKQGQV